MQARRSLSRSRPIWARRSATRRVEVSTSASTESVAAASAAAGWSTRFVGQLISRALHHANVTPQEASYRMGYADQSKLSRWMSGAEIPHLLGRFLAHADLCRGFLMALAEARGDEITAEVLIHVPIRRAS
jgi:hypothetical protein